MNVLHNFKFQTHIQSDFFVSVLQLGKSEFFFKISFNFQTMLHALLEFLQIQTIWYFQEKLLPNFLAGWKRVMVGSSKESFVWCTLHHIRFIFFVIFLCWDGLMFVSLSSLYQNVLLRIKQNYSLLILRWRYMTESACTKTNDNHVWK